jgi:hypothetical protein
MRFGFTDIGDDNVQRTEWKLLEERGKQKEKSTSVKKNLS